MRTNKQHKKQGATVYSSPINERGAYYERINKGHFYR